jgi:dTDP-4-dehydrorhamnose 3,5-epimerase
MRLSIVERALGDVVVIEPEVFEDERGFFMETYRQDQFAELGLPAAFVQDNHSRSRKGVVRGLHFQYEPPMGKLMRVTLGTAFLVAVDIRPDSPTLGRWFGCTASAEDRRMVFAPAGFARGFCTLTDWVELQYKCTGIYSSKGEGGILWNDPAVGVEWPVADPLVSEKDRVAPTLAQWLARPEAARLAGPAGRS